MKTSDVGRKLIEEFEGCRLSAYLDQGGVPTIAVGHTLNVKMGDTCTPEEADAWLADDLKNAEHAVNGMVKAALRQPQFDALVSFVFNVGSGNFAQSTVLKRLNIGTPDYLAAADALLMWNKVAGEVNHGLVRRREAEKSLFLSTDSG